MQARAESDRQAVRKSADFIIATPSEQQVCRCVTSTNRLIFEGVVLYEFNTMLQDISTLMSTRNDDDALHATSTEQLERRVMDLALERTAARSGAIFLWDAKRRGLAVEFHLV